MPARMAPHQTDERVLCRTPTPGKRPTKIARWKFAAVRKALLKVVPRRGAGVEARELPKRMLPYLTAAQRRALGSASWYAVTVKLELEVRGELVRVPGAKPQRVLRGK